MPIKYYQGNFDGSRYGLVLANNQKQAAKIAGCTLYEFRRFWQGWPGKLSLSPPISQIKHFTLYTKWMDSGKAWVEGRCP